MAGKAHQRGPLTRYHGTLKAELREWFGLSFWIMEFEMQIKLERRAYLPHVTLGVLTCKGTTLVTLERGWHGNRPFESCIPEGRYACSRVISPRFGPTWRVDRVPGREDILFHAGNYPKDTDGCILLGQMLSEQEYSILQSRKAVEEFMAETAGLQQIDLFVTGYRPK